MEAPSSSHRHEAATSMSSSYDGHGGGVRDGHGGGVRDGADDSVVITGGHDCDMLDEVITSTTWRWVAISAGGGKASSAAAATRCCPVFSAPCRNAGGESSAAIAGAGESMGKKWKPAGRGRSGRRAAVEEAEAVEQGKTGPRAAAEKAAGDGWRLSCARGP